MSDSHTSARTLKNQAPPPIRGPIYEPADAHRLFFTKQPHLASLQRRRSQSVENRVADRSVDFPGPCRCHISMHRRRLLRQVRSMATRVESSDPTLLLIPHRCFARHQLSARFRESNEYFSLSRIFHSVPIPYNVHVAQYSSRTWSSFPSIHILPLLPPSSRFVPLHLLQSPLIPLPHPRLDLSYFHNHRPLPHPSQPHLLPLHLPRLLFRTVAATAHCNRSTRCLAPHNPPAHTRVAPNP